MDPTLVDLKMVMPARTVKTMMGPIKLLLIRAAVMTHLGKLLKQRRPMRQLPRRLIMRRKLPTPPTQVRVPERHPRRQVKARAQVTVALGALEVKALEAKAQVAMAQVAAVMVEVGVEAVRAENDVTTVFTIFEKYLPHCGADEPVVAFFGNG